MIRIVMPDQLSWQAGIEYGLQALAQVYNANGDFICYIRDEGPFLEAVAFAVYQLGLKGRIRYKKSVNRYLKSADIILLPRIYPLEQETIHRVLQWGGTVVTSDPDLDLIHPRLFLFPRRNWQALAKKIMLLADTPEHCRTMGT